MAVSTEIKTIGFFDVIQTQSVLPPDGFGVGETWTDYIEVFSSTPPSPIAKIQIVVSNSAGATYDLYNFPLSTQQQSDIQRLTPAQSFHIQYTYRVPTVAGTYSVIFNALDSSGRFLKRLEVRTILVRPQSQLLPIPQCPVASVGDWIVASNINGGVIEKQTTKFYNSDCTISKTTDSLRTVCNSGYHLSGTSCAIDAVPPPICTAEAGTVYNPTTKDCKGFTNGCQKSDLVKQGYTSQCLTEEGGGGGTGVGGETDCGTDVPNYNCCSYTSIDHDFCKGQLLCASPRKTSYLWLPEGNEGDCSKTANIDKAIGGNIAENSKSEDTITCINSIGTPSGCLNQKAKDYQQNQKQTGSVAGGVFSVEPSSVPSLSESLKDSRESDVLKSLCIDDDYCKSENCDDSKNTRDEIHKVVTNKDSLDSSLGKIDNRFKPMKLMQPVQLTGGTITKAGEEISGVCTEEFDFNTFFKDNQTMILIGGGILAAALVLPKLMGK